MEKNKRKEKNLAADCVEGDEVNIHECCNRPAEKHDTAACEDPSGFSAGTPTTWHQYVNASQSVTVHSEGLNKPRS